MIDAPRARRYPAPDTSGGLQFGISREGLRGIMSLLPRDDEDDDSDEESSKRYKRQRRGLEVVRRWSGGGPVHVPEVVRRWSGGGSQVVRSVTLYYCAIKILLQLVTSCLYLTISGRFRLYLTTLEDPADCKHTRDTKNKIPSAKQREALRD
eukprot:g79880.t1